MKRLFDFFYYGMKQMSGALLPRAGSPYSTVVDISYCIDDLKFDGNMLDKKNMRNDIRMLGQDFKRSSKLAELEFKITL